MVVIKPTNELIFVDIRLAANRLAKVTIPPGLDNLPMLEVIVTYICQTHKAGLAELSTCPLGLQQQHANCLQLWLYFFVKFVLLSVVKKYFMDTFFIKIFLSTFFIIFCIFFYKNNVFHQQSVYCKLFFLKKCIALFLIKNHKFFCHIFFYYIFFNGSGINQVTQSNFVQIG